MLPFPGVPLECVENDLQMGGVVEEVRVTDVDEEGSDIVLPDVVCIGFLDVEQVVVGNGLFVGAVAFADIGLQLAYGCMEVDEDIGLHDLGLEDVEKILIEAEFLIGQIDLGK